MKRRNAVILTTALFVAGCATQPATTPPLVPAELVNPAPKPVHIPPDPLDSLPPVLREAYLHGEGGPIRDGFSWEYAFDPHGSETIYTSPLHVTEIILGDGERITNVASGDSDRFEVSASGNRILVKPTPAGHSQAGGYTGGAATAMPLVAYSTNLIAETDHRTYHFQLQSTPHRWMEQVTFFFPDDITAARMSRANALRQAAQQVSQARAADSLSFNYKIDGPNVPWRPAQVFRDSSHTYIQFTDSTPLQGEMPALYSGSGKNMAIVNYETRGSAYIADRVLTQAALVEGDGANRQVVRIESTDAH